MRSAVGIPFLSALTSGCRQAEGGEDVKVIMLLAARLIIYAPAQSATAVETVWAYQQQQCPHANSRHRR